MGGLNKFKISNQKPKTSIFCFEIGDWNLEIIWDLAFVIWSFPLSAPLRRG